MVPYSMQLVLYLFMEFDYVQLRINDCRYICIGLIIFNGGRAVQEALDSLLHSLIH